MASMKKEQLKKQIGAVLEQSPFAAQFKRVSLFGSHVHGAARADSDIDLLVEFVQPVSFFELARINRYLEKELRKKIDLITVKALSPYFRDHVLKEAENVYAR